MGILVLGLGNILLKDEGFGVRVAEAVLDRYILPAGVEVIDGGTSAMDLLDAIAGCEHLIVADAVRASRPPASLVRLTGEQVPAYFRTKISPHQVGLSDVLATLSSPGG
jgi:hydrogenase maturation protease